MCSFARAPRSLSLRSMGGTYHLPISSVDVVMFADVLHHTSDPEVLLREAQRVARQAVVLKDHTRDGLLAYTTLRFMDWVGNAHHGVVLPYNYWPEARWKTAFASLGLKIQKWQSKIPLYPWPASLVSVTASPFHRKRRHSSGD